jgi:signal transduction histidine kinase
MATFDEVRALAIFDGVADDVLHDLLDASDDIAFEPDDVLWIEGQPANFWWVLIEGRIDLVRHVGPEKVVLGALDLPGRWAGGFQAWDDAGVYLASSRCTGEGRVLRVPASALRSVLQRVPLAGHFIDGLYRTARRIDAGARERDALVALGTLSAGLAHELNNPAAAATRAVGNLQAEVDGLLDSLHRLAASRITADQFARLDALRREIPAASGVPDPLAVADREEEVSTWLTRHGVGRDWVLGPSLAAAGVDPAWCERVAELLEGPALEAGLEWVASTLTVTSLLTEVRESTRRVSDLVASVKSYSQMDRAELQRIELTDGLESTLTMLGAKLGDITIVRDYAALPQVDAYAGELNQVWTNLIDNAVDAMGGRGTLRLTTRPGSIDGGDAVVVAVGDTGSGMPPAVVARAFEAFYTTKDVGRGTGLGLDIARRIVVERHHGTITIESDPGDTVITVSIPLTQRRT